MTTKITQDNRKQFCIYCGNFKGNWKNVKCNFSISKRHKSSMTTKKPKKNKENKLVKQLSKNNKVKLIKDLGGKYNMKIYTLKSK